MIGQYTNADRAEWARAAQNAFDAIVYQPFPGWSVDDVEPLDTRISDLIADLLHLARREAGVTDVRELCERAIDNHDIEVAEDREE